MQFKLRTAHRLARLNYLTRTVSFAFSFMVVLANLIEQHFVISTLLLGVVTLLIYPQLAYLHAAMSSESKRAEMRNMNIDSIVMGIWAAQLQFALWPLFAVVAGIGLNNAICGGTRRVLVGLTFLGLAALAWSLVLQRPVELVSGPVVTGMCFVGLFGYVTTLGISLYKQNQRLLNTSNILKLSNEQFRFIADQYEGLVFVLDTQHRFRFASQTCAKYFEPGKLADGREWIYLVHAEDRQTAEEFLARARSSPQAERAQFRMVPDRGFDFTVECQANPVRAEGGYRQMIVLVCRDLTTPRL